MVALSALELECLMGSWSCEMGNNGWVDKVEARHQCCQWLIIQAGGEVTVGS